MSFHRAAGSGSKRTGKTNFKDSWLDEVDVNGDSPRLYVQKTDKYSFKCSWCQTQDLSVDNNGKQGLVQHYKSKKHRETANLRAGRTKGQITFDVRNDENQNKLGDSETESEEDEVEEGDADEDTNDVSGGGGGGKRGIKDFFKPVHRPVTVPTTVKMNLDNKAVQAEIKLALKAVECDWSYNSMDDICEFLSDLAPDSSILKKMKMKSCKLSYMISHGLGPYFHDILVQDLRNAPSFTLGLDSATTKQNGLTKSLDFKVRYFSERHGMVSYYYSWSIAFLMLFFFH